MVAYLVPAGNGRFELYSEAVEEPTGEPAPHEGRFRRWMHRASVRWHELTETARRNRSQSTFGRWRDRLICRLAESIAEQRTLWALRSRADATVRFPSTLDQPAADQVLRKILDAARRHHLRWFIVDLVLFLASGVFFFVPGPNIIAYYFAFRFIGHLQSWRGARQAMEVVAWTFQPDASLAELDALAGLPRAARASRVAAIAAQLNLRRLSAFFDRVAVPST
jgi:hypothetical protein